MEGRSAVWLLAALLLEALISAEDQNSLKYFEVGGKLVLRPEPGLFSGTIRSIAWKLNGSLVSVLDEGQPLIYNPVFGDRAKVDTTTGVLEIRNTMKSDSGVYTVEINNKIQDGGYDAKAIKQVPKPVVNLTCTQQLESCSLSCDGDVTEAGPVTFYFKKGDFVWEEGEQNIKIMNDEDTQAVKTFYCRMENPLGQKDSEPVENPFGQTDSEPVENPFGQTDSEPVENPFGQKDSEPVDNPFFPAERSYAGRIVGSVVVLLVALGGAAGVVLCSA